MGKKKFIDKKKSATFQLVARDSSDPNYDDSPGNDRVFVRVDNSSYSVDSLFPEDNPDHGSGADGYDDDPNSIYADAPEDGGGGDYGHGYGSSAASSAAQPLPDNVRKEILELGFPDDGDNYLLHMREIRNTGGGSAFYQNSKAKLGELPRDEKAYDASRLRISETEAPNEKVVYSVASKTVNVRVQKVVDSESGCFNLLNCLMIVMFRGLVLMLRTWKKISWFRLTNPKKRKKRRRRRRMGL